ncbi:lipopolysaccharide-induced tumor necrosis factor-alpha factor-like [Uranotaenia lowii]|uniref:lipopolysaccharide-induced tumor necrosis factor-alpha factor-like n=1 Tax=Uranotaenia lowii TaxID=190385 RepID=UPI00247A6D65|nr:lipopolysaccharide-induced tumor necrosis factor-alpha factor-like [Uranotaenia lowii]
MTSSEPIRMQPFPVDARGPPFEIVVTSSTIPVTIGRKSTTLICPACRALVRTKVNYNATTSTHCCALLLCCFSCWTCCCCCCPYCCNWWATVDHYCPNCRCYLGSFQRT